MTIEVKRLVSALEALVEDKDRSVLASLRRALQPERSVDALRFVLPFVSGSANEAWRTRDENDAVLLAGLFALHPQSGSISLAKALRLVANETGSDSVEARFRALLNADRSELPIHLRHAVSLVSSQSIPIDWRDLAWTLRGWDQEIFGDSNTRRSAKRRWASDFWAGDQVVMNEDGKDART